MKYSSEFRNREVILSLAAEIRRSLDREITLMEVCGGHTMAIHRFGLPDLLPPELKLLSGPGCPVCVSGQQFLDAAIAYCRMPGVAIVTYGDLIRVPGSHSSLEREKAAGADVRIVYSVLEALDMAGAEPEKRFVFPGIGFETTAPATAASILEAERRGLKNFFVLSAHKVMPPVMKALVEDGVRLDGFIAPGHVTAVTGPEIYTDLAEKHKLGVVVAGFEPADLLQSVLMLVRQVTSGRPAVEVQYSRVVKPGGNKAAQLAMERVFGYRDDTWRGLGSIPLSGLGIRREYSGFDAEVSLPVDVPPSAEPKGCICGSILRGLKTPADCPLFARACTPADPVGACMVSGEGTCATYYKYRK